MRTELPGRAGALRKLAFTPETFLLSYPLPDFYFHVVTACNILRARGGGAENTIPGSDTCTLMLSNKLSADGRRFRPPPRLVGAMPSTEVRAMIGASDYHRLPLPGFCRCAASQRKRTSVVASPQAVH
ncbi:DUF1993 family protein [Hyphomicrobium sp. MC8b]|uniref:DUF1993 family protein n=1 Tax=Hyphomicrobium sp. MC8b TaxID=300273 RepID=UPI00391D05C0